MTNDLLLRAAKRLETERTPVWMMRQAGRYLPEYRAVRARADFLTLCRTPELAAEVTIQPVDLIGVDAAIIFSDILVVPEAMGMELVVEEGKGGPRFPPPVSRKSDIDALDAGKAADRLRYVYDALALTKRELGGRVPLIGFAGAPWTLAAYAVEGRGTKDFLRAKRMLHEAPESMRALLDKLAATAAEFLIRQIRSGADIVQIFDTWAGLLSKGDFLEFSLPYIRRMTEQVKIATGAPVIVFARGANSSLAEIASSGCDVMGLDWTVDIGEARLDLGAQTALQGNLDPAVLHAPPDVIRRKTKALLDSWGPHPGHIFNLGHGIHPDVPPEHARTMVEAVKTHRNRVG